MRRWIALAILVVVACGSSTRAPDVPSERPIPYTAALLERIHAAGEADDVTGVMDDKAADLLVYARLRDDELTRGSLPKSLVRELATGYLVHSNLYLNVPSVRDHVKTRVRESADDREQLLLAPLVEWTESSWVGWIRQALERTQDPIALELVLARIQQLGRWPTSHPETLFDAIIAARGTFPLTVGIPGADRDLLRAALAAQYDTTHAFRGYHIGELPIARTRVDLWRAVLDATDTRPRGDAAAFGKLVAPLYAQPIHYDTRTHPRITDAFAMRGVSPAERARLLARLLALRDADVTKYDTTGMDLSSPTVLPQGAGHLVHAAALILAREPGLVDADPELHRIVAAFAAEPFDTSGGLTRDQILLALHPIVARIAASPVTFVAWAQSIRELAARQDTHTFYANYVAIARMFTLADHAPELAAPLLADMTVVPMATPAHVNLHKVFVRAATIATLSVRR